jgi:hypothetical protein
LPDDVADELDAYPDAGAEHELQHEEPNEEAAVRSAFAAMEAEAPAAIERSRFAARETPPE